MRKVILAMQITLDGYIAGRNDEMDWSVTGEDEWKEIFKDLEAVDTCLLGRKMYPGYSEYWRSALSNPKSSPDELAYAKYADRTLHIVFSKSTTSVDWKNTRIATDVDLEVRKLKQAPGKNIVVWGGGNFASSLINLGVIDEYRLTLNPTILGDGKSLFNNFDKRERLSLIDSMTLKSGAIIIRYRSLK